MSDDRPKAKRDCSTPDCGLMASNVPGRGGLCGSCFMDSISHDEHEYEPESTPAPTRETEE